MGIICGGPNLERGISLNSARSLLDHLQEKYHVTPFYVNADKVFYILSPAHLYSNTPADFDFKINKIATPLSETECLQALKQQDIIFPVIHGTFGEDGTLFDFLEEHHINFIGSPAQSCRKAFNKYNALEILKQNTYYTQSFLSVQSLNDLDKIDAFWHANNTKMVVKPVCGGSSIDIFIASTLQHVRSHCTDLLKKDPLNFPIIETFCEGREFTVCVLENAEGDPVALIPSEIELTSADHFFDFRKKYLPTDQTHYHCPPRFSRSLIQEIRQQAQAIFKLFNLKSFARLDGWVLKGDILYFSDINIICGLEQNSFLFQQAAYLGISHAHLCSYIIQNALPAQKRLEIISSGKQSKVKKKVYILLGGSTAERQVSLMSGTNVWLKLRNSAFFEPHPFVFYSKETILTVPPCYLLNHTIEEIFDQSRKHKESQEQIDFFKHDILHKLNISQDLPFTNSETLSFDAFCQKALTEKAFVFLALHGGEGEDGTLQSILQSYNIPHNGSKAGTSSLCMDKYATAQKIAALNHSSILSLPQRILDLSKTFENHFETLWTDLTATMETQTLLVKPQKDGSSTGIAVLHSAEELEKYIRLTQQHVYYIPAHTFLNQENRIEMPDTLNTLLIEPFIETDSLKIVQGQLHHTPHHGWIELTVGVIEKAKEYHAFNPSITVAEGRILTLEEKFQGGTGVNITPPPVSIMSPQALENFKKTIEAVAFVLNIENYARFDTFFNTITQKMIVIECNSLPALTPSTVLFHQALAEDVPLYPKEFFEYIIQNVLENS